MTVPYRKPALTYEDQADLLMQRGLEADRDVLLRRLRAVGLLPLLRLLASLQAA